MPRVRLECLMRFSKIKKKKVTESVFELFLKNLVSKGLLQRVPLPWQPLGYCINPYKKFTLIGLYREQNIALLIGTTVL